MADEEIKKEVEEEENIEETQADEEEIPEEEPAEETEKVKSKPVKEKKKKEKDTGSDIGDGKAHLYALRTTANREDQVMDFITSNAVKKKLEVLSVIRAHGMRGYIFVEAMTRTDAEQAAYNVPYARGILPNEIRFEEIDHTLEQVKKDVNIQKNDIVEIISGPFKREKAKVTRIDKTKEDVVVELLEAAVPIPITVKLDAVKVIRRDTADEDDEGKKGEESEDAISEFMSKE
ncbi:MAG: transcription elongation factor Spt5 [Candidatus Woesearchaeota archaeon]